MSFDDVCLYLTRDWLQTEDELKRLAQSRLSLRDPARLQDHNRPVLVEIKESLNVATVEGFVHPLDNLFDRVFRHPH